MFLLQEDRSKDDFSAMIVAVLRELKQKEFTNILFELPLGLSVNRFFQMTKEIGLAGEDVHFVLVSLDYQGESLPDGLREEESSWAASARSSTTMGFSMTGTI